MKFWHQEVTGSISKKFGTFDLTFGYANLKRMASMLLEALKNLSHILTRIKMALRENHIIQKSHHHSQINSINASVNQSDSTLEQKFL